ncbi:MAG: (Fe-S)-binding protein, partial [Myxococcota bacterium]|nr:(Fe-S)-binding protein [Myxococcota bacterium]
LAGDREAFARQAGRVARALDGRARVIVADAGCALALVRRYPEVGVTLPCPVEPLVELAAASLSSFEPQADEGGRVRGPVRWHDPCQLGRGLGIYDAPRALLERALGRPPDEFDECRERAVCSGAGGLVPATLPDVARKIADSRLEAHLREGGGRLVTACAASLVMFRRRAGRYDVQVEDVIEWIGRLASGRRRGGRTR